MCNHVSLVFRKSSCFAKHKSLGYILYSVVRPLPNAGVVYSEKPVRFHMKKARNAFQRVPKLRNAVTLAM